MIILPQVSSLAFQREAMCDHALTGKPCSVSKRGDVCKKFTDEQNSVSKRGDM